MTLLRPSASTTCALASLTARMRRIETTFVGATTVDALRRADAEMAQAIAALKLLRLAARGDVAAAVKREREDRQRRSA